jgi:hypothetical protein
VLLKLSGGLDVLDKNLKTANDEWERGTSLQNEYALASKSIFAEATSVSNAVKILAEDMSVTLLPALKELLGWFKTGVDTLSSFGKFLGEAAAKVSLAVQGFNVSELEAAGLNAPVVYDPSSVRRGATTSGLGFGGASQGPADPNAPFGTFSGNFAVGTRFVPKTGLFQLHQGEEVRNRGEVRQDRKAQINVGGITVPIRVVADKAPEQQAKELARHIDRELKNLKASYA